MKPTNTEKQWIVLPDASTVAQEACELVKKAANKAIETKGLFRIVLAGGTTPGQIYQMLAKEAYDWSQWEFYLGDERCLPVESTERNSQMAMTTWLDNIDVPDTNIYFIPSELGAEPAAKEYAATIKDKVPFDMVLLGMGEDGHTASLFPGHKHNESELTHAVHNAPKPPSDRVSLSVSALSNAYHVLMIVTGAGKKDSVDSWQKGEPLPIAQISAIDNLTVMLDEAACPIIKHS